MEARGWNTDCAALDREESVVIRFIRALCGSFYGKLMPSTIGISANELSKSTQFQLYFECTSCNAGGCRNWTFTYILNRTYSYVCYYRRS